MKKFAFGLLTALILIGISYAADQPKHSASYNNHSLSFEVPQNWSVVKDIQEGNDTQIVLSDGVSAVRIDHVKNQNLRKALGEYLEYHLSKYQVDRQGLNLENLSDGDLYKISESNLNGAYYDYYIKNIITPKTRLGQSGSGISVKPDAAISTNFAHETDPIEWILVWIEPGHEDEFVGVHALFTGNYTQKAIEWPGSPYDNFMPEPLWTVLATINRGDKPLPKPSMGSSLPDLV